MLDTESTSNNNKILLDTESSHRLAELGKLHSSEHVIEGGHIVVDYAYIPFFETPLKPGEERHISIYLPGLPHGPEQTTAGDPQEIALVGDLLKKNSTELIVIKPEGLDQAAFRDREGRLTGDKVTKASLDQLFQICSINGIDISSPSVRISFYGYSEGASQGASLAKALLDRGVHVLGLTVLEPSGIIGYDSPSSAEVYPKHAWKIAKALMTRKTKRPVARTELGHHFSSELIDSYDKILEGSKPTRKDSHKAIVSILRRFSFGLAGLKTSRGIQPDRLRLAWSINPDYEALLEKEVPLSVFSGTKSEVFPIDDMRSALERLHKKFPGKVQHLTSDTPHSTPNTAAKGIGFMIALKENR